MSKSVSYCILIVLAGLLAGISASSPQILSDNNNFMKNFVNHEFLNLVGLIMAITLAAAGQVHLALNSIEEKHNKENIFIKTRQNIKSASYALILLFVFSIFIVVVKPIIGTEEWSQSVFNGLSLIVLVWNSLILISITSLTFSIKYKQ